MCTAIGRSYIRLSRAECRDGRGAFHRCREFARGDHVEGHRPCFYEGRVHRPSGTRTTAHDALLGWGRGLDLLSFSNERRLPSSGEGSADLLCPDGQHDELCTGSSVSDTTDREGNAPVAPTMTLFMPIYSRIRRWSRSSFGVAQALHGPAQSSFAAAACRVDLGVRRRDQIRPVFAR